MKTDLAIIGQGAVTPAGIGIEMLSHKPSSVPVASLRQPGKTWPVLRVDQKDPIFTRWQREPRLRRASPVTFFLVEAAEQALQGLTAEEHKRTGLIVAFSAGCLVYSRRFFEGIVKQGQRTASPALFPETVFNSPVSHVAAVLGLEGAAYALVGDEAAWVAALKTAAIWLKRGRVEKVLVLGAEEFDPLVLDAYQSARWLRRQNNEQGFLTSEGVAGVLVRSATPTDSLVITHSRDGVIYRTRAEAAMAAHELLRGANPAWPAHRSARHNWFGDLEKEVLSGHPELTPQVSPYLGEAFTASAAWNTLRASHALAAGGSGLVPVWGLNHQLGMLELTRRNGDTIGGSPRVE